MRRDPLGRSSPTLIRIRSMSARTARNRARAAEGAAALKLAMAQIGPRPGDLEGNADRAVLAIRQARLRGMMLMGIASDTGRLVIAAGDGLRPARSHRHPPPRPISDRKSYSFLSNRGCTPELFEEARQASERLVASRLVDDLHKPCVATALIYLCRNRPKNRKTLHLSSPNHYNLRLVQESQGYVREGIGGR